MIGSMKAEGPLARKLLKGSLGDALHAVLCGAGQSLRMILAHLRVLHCALVGQRVLMTLLVSGRPPLPTPRAPG